MIVLWTYLVACASCLVIIGAANLWMVLREAENKFSVVDNSKAHEDIDMPCVRPWHVEPAIPAGVLAVMLIGSLPMIIVLLDMWLSGFSSGNGGFTVLTLELLVFWAEIWAAFLACPLLSLFLVMRRAGIKAKASGSSSSLWALSTRIVGCLGAFAFWTRWCWRTGCSGTYALVSRVGTRLEPCIFIVYWCFRFILALTLAAIDGQIDALSMRLFRDWPSCVSRDTPDPQSASLPPSGPVRPSSSPSTRIPSDASGTSLDAPGSQSNSGSSDSSHDNPQSRFLTVPDQSRPTPQTTSTPILYLDSPTSPMSPRSFEFFDTRSRTKSAVRAATSIFERDSNGKRRGLKVF